MEYRSTGIHEIDIIRDLWNDLNILHRERTPHFRPYYERMSFDDRKREFQKIHEAGLLQVELALDPMTAMYMGY